MISEMGKKERKAAMAAQENQERDRIQRTLDVIERAFDGVPPPDEEHRTLYQAEAWDAYKTIDQRRDHKGRWQDLPPSHIRDCPNALPHLDKQGIHYYLPALMSHFVRTPQDRNRWSYPSLQSTLEPSTGDLKSYQERRFSRLTFTQRTAIVAFLEHIEADDEPLLVPWRRVLERGDDPSWFDSFY
jgi:hypothetical protein